MKLCAEVCGLALASFRIAILRDDVVHHGNLAAGGDGVWPSVHGQRCVGRGYGSKSPMKMWGARMRRLVPTTAAYLLLHLPPAKYYLAIERLYMLYSYLANEFLPYPDHHVLDELANIARAYGDFGSSPDAWTCVGLQKCRPMPGALARGQEGARMWRPSCRSPWLV